MSAEQSNELGTLPVGRLLFKLAVPAITAQVVNMLYNIVDRIYIGHIPQVGATALTGVGVTFPIIMVISAFSALVGMGGAPRAAICMGRGDNKSAERILGNCAASLVAVSLLLTVLLRLFLQPLLMAFGASAETLPYGLAYMSIYAMGTLFVQMSLGLNAFITTQGFAKYSMITVLIGAVINIVLDPILIFGLDMGVRGAALASIFSQCCSMLWVLRFLTGERTLLRIRRKNLRISASVMLPVMALGVSPFIMQSTESLIVIVFNRSLQRYGGDLAVGAMTILTSVMQLTMMPLSGLTQGGQPITGYNFGAGKYDRVWASFRILLTVCLCYSGAMWAAAQLAPGFFVRLFANNDALLEIGSWALRVYMGAGFIMGAQIACQQTFIAVGQAKISLFLALLRKIVLLIPLALLLPHFFADKVFAVFLAEPIADALATATTLTLFFTQFPKILAQDARERGQDA